MARANLTLFTEPCMTADDSLVAWLALRLSGVAFHHRVVTSELRVSDQRVEAPLPRLEADGQSIVTSSAIVSLLAEHHPELWPRDWRARADAKAAAAEAFAGFRHLKTYLPMAVAERFSPAGRVLQRCELELLRLQDLWHERRARHGDRGPFLFGEIGYADAFQVPLAARCVTYGLPLAADAEAYVEALMDWPQMAAWLQRAAGSIVADAVDYSGEILDLDKPPAAPAARAKESVLASLIQSRSSPAAKPASPAPAAPPPVAQSSEPAPTASEPPTQEPPASKPADPAPHDIRPALDASEPVPGDIIDTAEQRSARELLRSTFGVGPTRTTRRPFQPPPERSQPAAPPATTSSKSPPATPEPDEVARRARIAGIKPIGGEIRRRR